MSMKVALIGNMNNANFAAMRHLRDQGVDAHLLMYSDETEHFYPQHDTWHWEKWSSYVRQLPISNGGLDSLLVSERVVRRELDGFDAYIGNGISPVLFRKMGRQLDLFLPYAEGVEFVIHHLTRWSKPVSTAFSLMRRGMMEAALKNNVKAVGSANLHDHSQETFKRLGIAPLNLPLLALYGEPLPPLDRLPSHVAPLVQRMQQANLVVFSHVSQIWKNLPVPHFMGGVGKRNNWLVEGFARYSKQAGGSDALLCLFDYGVDVPATKALVRELGIEAQVIWFPRMSRREIACLLPHVDIGGSEFAGMYWGGCGWEFLATGVPMLHQLCDAEQYEESGTSLPPFFNVDSPGDIAQVLANNDRDSLRAKGRCARAWYDAHQGQVLAKRYVDLITRLRER